MIILLSWSVSATFAIPVRLTLTDGRIIQGELVSENDQAVILRISDIESRFEKNKIKKIDRQDNLKEAYRKKRKALADDDLEGRYKLASWLFYEKKAYQLAQQELLELKKAFPDDPRVPLLLKVVINKQTLRPKPPVTRKPARITTSKSIHHQPIVRKTHSASSQTTNPLIKAAKLLTPEQINILKVWEVQLANRPKIRFKKQDLRDFLKQFADDETLPHTKRARDRFVNQLEGYQQLERIFQAKARPFYNKAKVIGDPEVFKEFKNLHRKYILNRCATSACHGGPKAQGIYLFNKAAGRKPDQIIYSNFYILSRYTKTYKGKKYDMIDRQDPSRSLLLQFGLPAQDAVVPHPANRYMLHPPFPRGREDPLYRQLEAWIAKLYPNPDYRLEVQPTSPSPTTSKTRHP